MTQDFYGQVYKVWFHRYDNPTLLEAFLDKMYWEGWEFVAFSGEYLVFKWANRKEKESEEE